MKRLIATGAIAVLSFAALAEMKKPSPEDLKLIEKPYTKLTADEKARRNEAVRLRTLVETGGEMCYPGTPKGTIRYINLQSRVPAADLQRAVKAFGNLMDYDVQIVNADCPASMKIKIVDDPAAPVLLTAPEDKWAQVNVAKLGDAKTKPAFLAARTRKEMLRAFAFLAAGSQSEMPLCRPLKDVADLDQFAERGFTVDIIMRSKNYLELMGVTPRERSNYRAVISAGYDVAPTNDYQKAIYEEVKKTVKFDKKLP